MGMLPSLPDEAWIDDDGIATLAFLEGEGTHPHIHLKPVHTALCRLPIALLATLAIASHLREIASPWDDHQKKKHFHDVLSEYFYLTLLHLQH